MDNSDAGKAISEADGGDAAAPGLGALVQAMTPGQVARFRAKVAKAADGCWLWTDHR